MKTDAGVVSAHIQRILPLLKRDATEGISRPYLSVNWAGDCYDNILFGWDAHHVALRLASAGEPEWLRFMTENFVDQQDAQSGFIPAYFSVDDGIVTAASDVYMPFLAQGVLTYAGVSGDTSWPKSILANLSLYLQYYEEHQQDKSGLFFWKYCWSGGVDNDLAISFFPNSSLCPPNINSLVYLEYRAMAKLCSMLQEVSKAAEYQRKADSLRDAINNILWMEEYACYAPYNRKSGKVSFSLDVGANKGEFAFLSWTNLMPLYAAIAPLERGMRTIEEYLLSPMHFFAEWGIRSASKSSEYYNNAVWGNPPRFDCPERLTNSNWQGPVWVLVNYFMFRALINYGYASEAEDAMHNLHKALACDITKNGMMHENYDAETGEPLYAEHFGSWNVLADLMPSELSTGRSILDITICKP